MPLPGRSLQRGETTLDELRRLTERFDEAQMLLEDDLFDADYDALLIDGDLELDALNTFDAGLCVLVVTGNLRVKGGYCDFDDPATGVFVLGDLSAGSVLTNGSLGVAGDLRVERTLAGLGNDYSARVDGTVRAAVFLPEYHWFDFRGPVAFDTVLDKNAGYRVPDAVRPALPPALAGSLLFQCCDPALRAAGIDGLNARDLDASGWNDLLEVKRVRQFVAADRALLVG